MWVESIVCNISVVFSETQCIFNRLITQADKAAVSLPLRRSHFVFRSVCHFYLRVRNSTTEGNRKFYFFHDNNARYQKVTRPRKSHSGVDRGGLRGAEAPPPKHQVPSIMEP